MELYRKVRLACRDGMSERAAARHFGVSRESVRKMPEFSVPPGYRRTAPVRRPKLDGFTGLIDEWLRGDRKEDHRKQRHTAKRIFGRLRDEHDFTGGYTIVKDYVREHHRRRREMYVPLVHPPGHGQADFGEAWAFIGGVKRKVHFFAFDLPQSDASYVRAYPAATAEAWVAGHVHAFSFFGAVALSMLYDNDRCLVSRIERDGTRRRTQLFSGFLSHYLIRDRYGRPGKGNDKGAVEGLVGWSRRNFMVPLPRFASFEAFNEYLEQRCRERQGDVLRGHRESIAERLKRDLEAMTALPAAPFDACHQAPGQVSSQSLVRYRNSYSEVLGDGDGAKAGEPHAVRVGPAYPFAERAGIASPVVGALARAQQPSPVGVASLRASRYRGTSFDRAQHLACVGGVDLLPRAAGGVGAGDSAAPHLLGDVGEPRRRFAQSRPVVVQRDLADPAVRFDGGPWVVVEVGDRLVVGFALGSARFPQSA